MPRVARSLASLGAAALVALGLVACEPGPRVLILGDSLTIEAKGSGDWQSILTGYAVDWTGTKYMTAPCNGLAVARKLSYVPDVVVINYAGNAGSFSNNCMSGERGQALADRYAKDVQSIIHLFRNGKTKLVIMGAPARKATLEEGNLVFARMQSQAAEARNQIGFFDGGRLITPDRTRLTRAAACLSPRETGDRCGTSQDPTKNYIRDAGLEHLCPTGGRINGTCDMYSSGSVRLSLNLRDAIKVARVAVH